MSTDAGIPDDRPSAPGSDGAQFLRYRPDGLLSQSLSAQYRYVARHLINAVQELAVPHAPANSRLLDYGCAGLPYRYLFDPTVEYVGADLPGNPDAQVTLRADGTVPLRSESFDLVLSTQVLEHVIDPESYLDECRRLLKPGASLVLTTHGIMYYHPDPNDYWRWTRDGLSKLVEDSGLEVRELRGIMGLASAAVQLFQDATLIRMPRPLKRPYLIVMQQLVALADRPYSDISRLNNSLVLAVRAQRPS